MYLREHHNTILHIVCGDITNVEKEQDKFIINTSQQSIIEILNETENHKQLEEAFKNYGFDSFEVRKSKKQITDEDNINVLNKYFDNIVKIIDK